MKRILIIRPSAIGDIVMASPLIGALRRAWPRAYVAWLAEPYARDLLGHNALLDEVILWPKGYWQQLAKSGRFLKLGREIKQFGRELRRHRFDLAIDGQGLLRSRLLARLSGARERVGLDSREPGRSLMTRVVSRGSDLARISSEYLELAKALKLPIDDFRMRVTVGSEELSRTRQLLAAAGVSGPYVLLCPFTTRPQKHWLEERWAQLALELATDLNLAVAIAGGSGDTEPAKSIQAKAAAKLHDFTGRTSLGQSAALVQLAHLVVGVDTGLTHLGIALDRPTIALFGATCPYTEPANTRAVVLYHREPCSPCRRRPTCQEAYSCMRAITVEEVTATARKLLAERSIE